MPSSQHENNAIRRRTPINARRRGRTTRLVHRNAAALVWMVACCCCGIGGSLFGIPVSPVIPRVAAIRPQKQHALHHDKTRFPDKIGRRKRGDELALSSNTNGASTEFGEPRRKTGSLLPWVVRAAVGNIVLNAFRPDPDITAILRIPRILWEAGIAIVAGLAIQEEGSSVLLLLLSWMTISTALIDIFVWGPVFAFATQWETCSGGGWFDKKPRVCVPDYAGGWGRTIGSVQSSVGGMFYLLVGALCWSEHRRIQELRKIQSQAAAFQHVANTAVSGSSGLPRIHGGSSQ